MFDQSQIQEFKEALNMIDQKRDGFVDKEDLHDMLASLGKKIQLMNPEDVIRNPFACFDEEATGTIQEDYLRELLTTMGDRFTDEEVRAVQRSTY
ncbi:unnamed protein product [Rangifer tarandus platyrhynchus]|uniref:Uncharacterized protein n=1 Tax=Rangifer tarandus platyrhynchus TaxID=3082113 RepID=A0AC59YC17_RANTA